MGSLFVTIIDTENYYGMKPFKLETLCKIVKDENNEQDHEAIRVERPSIDTVGYIANSANTVIPGTISAGRLYDKIDDHAYAQIKFITNEGLIALVVPAEAIDGEPEAHPIKETESSDAGSTKNKIGF